MSSRRNKISGLSGFVSFMKRRDAEEALRELDGFDWGGSVLRVGWSKAVPVGTRAMYSEGLFSFEFQDASNHLPYLKPIPPQKTDDVPGLSRDLLTEVATGIEIGTTEAGPALDTVASTRVGGADPVRTARAVLRHLEEETTGTETEGAITEGGQDPIAGRVLLEGTGTEDIPETQTKRNSWVMTTSPRSLFELLLWRSKAGVTIMRLR